MLKKYFLLLVVFSLIYSVSALSLSSKPFYQPGETLIAEIQGNILEPITRDKVELVRNGYLQVPIEYDIQKLGTTYFMYAIMPKNSNNYTLIVHNITTTEGGVVVSKDLAVNLTVIGETIPYSIKPGFITLQGTSKLTLTSNKDENLEILVGSPIAKNITLLPGVNSLELSNKNFPEGLTRLSVGSYTIPVYAVHPDIIRQELFIFPEFIEAVLLEQDERTFGLRIINNRPMIIKPQFQYDDSIFIVTPSTIDQIAANSSADINITLKKHAQNFSSPFTVSYGNESYRVPINIRYTKNSSSVAIPFSSGSEQKYCSELHGSFCPVGYECSSNIVTALDGNCCLGQCTQPQKTSYAWIGYLIGLIVLLVLIIVGGRYLKSKKSHGAI